MASKIPGVTHDAAAANDRLRAALADVESAAPWNARIKAATLQEAVQIAHEDVAGRSLTGEAARAYQALFDAADAWRQAESALSAARSAQNRLLSAASDRLSPDPSVWVTGPHGEPNDWSDRQRRPHITDPAASEAPRAWPNWRTS
jgi:hypothetical protein